MTNPVKSLSRKVYLTVKDFKKTAYHHYGDHPFSILKMIYYSMLRINTFILFERCLDDTLVPAQLPNGFTVIKPTVEMLENIRRKKDLPREFYYDKLHGVTNCYIAMHGDQAAYVHWVYLKNDYNRFLRLGNGVAELNYNTTLPEFRGKKLMGIMMLFIMNDLKNIGFKKAVGVVNVLNPPAIKSMAAAGFKEVREIKTIGYINKKYDVTI